MGGWQTIALKSSPEALSIVKVSDLVYAGHRVDVGG